MSSCFSRVPSSFTFARSLSELIHLGRLLRLPHSLSETRCLGTVDSSIVARNLIKTERISSRCNLLSLPIDFQSSRPSSVNPATPNLHKFVSFLSLPATPLP
uniref:Uncharacterized protein n=1 Tax=Arundo donax TaxID=35708 RepID=A0A0A8ZP23_ARUDO